MKIPLFPLDVVLFPGAALPLHIFESRYREMIEECLALNRSFGVVRAQQDGLSVVGCSAGIVRVLETYPDGRLDILCQGLSRFEIESLDNSRSFLQAEADFFEDEDRGADRPLREQCVGAHFETMELMGFENLNFALDLGQSISFQLASAIPSDLSFKQELLTLTSDAERTARLLAFYNTTLPKLRRGVRGSRVAGGNGYVM